MIHFSKSNFLLLITLPVLAIFFVGCNHHMAPSGSGGTYNAAPNVTTYSEHPFGTITLPGEWTTGKYNKSARQQYFYHKDTVTLVASIGPCTYYPFAKSGLDGYDFVKKYYDVENRYQTQLLDQTPKLLVEDAKNKYMIWVLRQDGIDQYYLCGVKDCDCKVCTYRTLHLKTRKYSEEKCKELLVSIFMK